MRTRNPAPRAFQPDPKVYEALFEARWIFGSTSDRTVYELQLDLATPAIITEEKGNAPAIGLPTLDGFLSYVAFRAALGDALQKNPNIAQSLIWQWNTALRDKTVWIDFPLPLREIILPDTLTLFDCSVGLPTYTADRILIPAGALFADQMNLRPYPAVADSIPLRRRVTNPFGRPMTLKRELETAEGPNKSLDNRLYFPLTTSYTFYFRGDKNGVERLLNYAQQEHIGLGKKTVLGYGQIARFRIDKAQNTNTTFTHHILNKSHLSLIKSLPYDYMFRIKNTQDQIQQAENEQLFGCRQFSLIAVIESFGAYRSPYWKRDKQTQILRYGSVIQAK
nr:hypothetical protein [Oscillochloris trichoides]